MSDSTNSEVKKNNSAPVPDASQYSTFFFITLFYFIARVMVGDGGKWDKILLAAYVFAVLIYENMLQHFVCEIEATAVDGRKIKENEHSSTVIMIALNGHWWSDLNQI